MEHAVHRAPSCPPRHDIQTRTFALACRIIDFCRQLAGPDYVIRRLVALPAVRPQAETLIDESHQILKILTTIIKNAESNPDRGQGPEH